MWRSRSGSAEAKAEVPSVVEGLAVGAIERERKTFNRPDGTLGNLDYFYQTSRKTGLKTKLKNRQKIRSLTYAILSHYLLSYLLDGQVKSAYNPASFVEGGKIPGDNK
jgi:hypothetical protein